MMVVGIKNRPPRRLFFICEDFWLLVGVEMRNYRRVSHLIRNLLEHTTDCEAVVPIVVVLGIDIGRIYVEVVHIVGIVVRTRPEVAVRTLIVGRPIVEVAGKRGT